MIASIESIKKQRFAHSVPDHSDAPVAEHATEPHYVPHPCFTRAGTARRLWGGQREKIQVAPYSLMPAVKEAAPPPERRAVLSTPQERTLFLRYNFAKYRLCRLARHGAPAKHAQAWALWQHRAQTAREQIIQANLPLAPTMAKRKRVEGVEFADKVSEGYMAILRSVEHFDVSRGFRFSTYACRALLACFYRMGTKAQTYQRHVPAQFGPAFERDDYADRRHKEQRSDAIACVRTALRHNVAELDEDEAHVITQRYRVGDGSKPCPFWKIGRTLGVSTECARQIEKRSLTKLREALYEFSTV